MRISDWSSDVCSSDLVDARAVADAAADLHLTREGGDDAFHRRAVDAGAREGAVEVDDVEVRGARIREKSRLRRRIVATDAGAAHTARGDPRPPPAIQVARRTDCTGGTYKIGTETRRE